MPNYVLLGTLVRLDCFRVTHDKEAYINLKRVGDVVCDGKQEWVWVSPFSSVLVYNSSTTGDDAVWFAFMSTGNSSTPVVIIKTKLWSMSDLYANY